MNTKDNKEEFQYYNDEWNIPKEYKIYMGVEAKKLWDKLIEEEFLKNDKPDGRRYKK